MTNIFLFDYELRLKSWAELREKIKHLDTANQCIEIDRYWQRAPMTNHYLHPDFLKTWPDPWQLIADNTFCNYSRALGMIYTLFLLGKKNIALVDAKDDNNNEVVLVLVDNAKYVLNYWPDMVVNIRITDFVITKEHDLSPLLNKLG